jgi:hypothetical protein
MYAMSGLMGRTLTVFTVSVLFFGCFYSCYSQSVMGNDGRIKKLFLSEVAVSEATRPEVTLNVVDSIRELGIDVCFTRYIPCYGSSVESANTCFEGTQDWADDSGEGISDSILELLPLHLVGSFHLLRFEDESVRYDSLSIPDRLAVTLALGNQLTSLEWKNGRWENGNLSVESTDASKSFKDADTSKAKSLWQNQKSGKHLSDSVVYINLKMICENHQTDSACREEIIENLSIYTQDEFVVRKHGNCLTARNRPHWTPRIKRFMQCYASQLCDCVTNSCDDLPYDSLALKGGNYFVRGDLVFIGSDVASYYRECEQWWKTLGFMRKPSMHEVELSLAKLFTGSTFGKIIWVGDGAPDTLLIHNCSGHPLEDSYVQPLYHIDLFFHPLGVGASRDTFYYIMAAPVDSLHPNSIVTSVRYVELKKRLAQTNERLVLSLRDAGLVPKPVVVPFGFAQTRSKEFFIAFANGHSERLEDGSFRYLLPDYLNPSSLNFNDQDYGESRDRAVTALKGAGIVVIPIQYHYGYQSALHCMSKVLIRDN